VEADDQVDELVDRARGGDAEAWRQLYQRAYPRLMAYAERRLGNYHEACDVVSETMTRAVGTLDRFHPTGGGFDAWLYRICRNLIVDGHRKRGRQTVPFVPDGEDNVASRLDDLVAGEEAVAVRAAFERLAPLERELLELRVIEGLSAEQTAHVLGKRHGAVRQAQSRALARLRVFLDEESLRAQ
jgi:RNA polymerase sigma-70 factor (ECF subfamily)